MPASFPIDWSREPSLDELIQAFSLISTNAREAICRLETLSKDGSIMARIYLGDIYRTGRVGPPNYQQAEQWYEGAAAMGSSYGQYLLGRLLLKNKRYDEARKNFTMSSDRGFSPASHILGRMYWRGTGVTADRQLAEMYLQKASHNGNIPARILLGRMMCSVDRSGTRVSVGAIYLIVGALQLLFALIFWEKTDQRLK